MPEFLHLPMPASVLLTRPNAPSLGCCFHQFDRAVVFLDKNSTKPKEVLACGKISNTPSGVSVLNKSCTRSLPYSPV